MSDVQQAFGYPSAYWWPESVKTIFHNALLLLGGDESPLMFGPSHVVWADDNFDDECIHWCLQECDKPLGYLDRFTLWELAIVRRSLEQLLTVPEDVRDCDPNYCYDPDDDTEEDSNVS